MGDHSKGIAFASDRVQVVRTYTCVTTTQAIFSVSHGAPLHLSSVSVSATCRTAQGHLTRYSLRPTNSHHEVLQCIQALPRRLAQDRRLFAPQLPAAHSSLVHPLCHQSPNPHLGPTPGRSMASAVPVCAQVMTFVPKSARFSADVHAPTVTTPRFTNCCSQKYFC